MSFSDDELWIGCESGIYIYNLRTDKYVHLKSSMYDPYSLSDNAVYSLCKDCEGGVWIALILEVSITIRIHILVLKDIIRRE